MRKVVILGVVVVGLLLGLGLAVAAASQDGLNAGRAIGDLDAAAAYNALQASSPGSSVLLPLGGQFERDATLYVQNAAVSTATVSLSLLDLDGVEVYSDSFALAGHGATTVELDALSSLPSTYSGVAVFTSDQSVVAIANVRTTDKRSLMSYEGEAAGAPSIILPQVRFNTADGADSYILVHNTALVSATIHLDFTPLVSGTAHVEDDILPARATRIYQGSDLPELGVEFDGWVRITGTQDLVAVAEIWNDDYWMAAAYTGLPEVDAGSDFYAPRQLKDNTAELWSGLQVVNVDAVTQTVTTDWYTTTGSLEYEDVVELAPNDGRRYLLYDPFGPTSPYDGMAAGSAAGNLVALSEYLDYSASMDGLALTLGVPPTRTDSTLYAPHVAHFPAAGWSTDISLYNVGGATANATVSFYLPNGDLTVAIPLAIGANGLERLSTADVSELGAHWEGVAEITSDQPLAVDVMQQEHDVEAAEIVVSPPALNSTIFFTRTILTRSLTLLNYGDVPLNWSIQEAPAVEWMTVTRTSGAVPALGYDMIDVVFAGRDLAVGTVTTTLLVNSNDPVTPVVIVPVTLTLAEGEKVFLPTLLRNYAEGLIFGDDFSDPDSGWYTGNGVVSWNYVSGEYEIALNAANLQAAATAPMPSVTDMSVEAALRVTQGSGVGYGLVFGYQSGNAYYAFYVKPGSQNYALFRRDVDGGNPSGGVNVALLAGSSAAIHTGSASNHLQVRRVGSQIDLYVNDQWVNGTSDSTYLASSPAGLFASTGSSAPAVVRADNFAVYEATP